MAKASVPNEEEAPKSGLKQKAFKAFAILVILMFILELFVVFLYSNGPSDDGTPTATPRASVNPNDLTPGLPGSDASARVFIGTGVASATITGFDAQSVLQCPATISPDVSTRIGLVPGVKAARDYGGGLVGFFANETVQSDFEQLASAVLAAARPDCPDSNSTVFRLARVRFDSTSVPLASKSGAKQTLTVRAIQSFFSNAGRPVVALAPASTRSNQTVTLQVTAQTHAGMLLPDAGDDVTLEVLSGQAPQASASNASTTQPTAPAGIPALNGSAPGSGVVPAS